MNVEKMIKRDISVEIANYLTNNLPCYEKKNIDDEKTYETNFLHLMNVIGKNVINIPRKVHYSRELIKKMNEEFPKELCDLIKLFEKKFDKGESVKGYLSKKAFDVEFKDILLNQWGIKHLHLTDKEKTINLYDYYLNLTNSNTLAKFYYKFKFGNDILEYEYQKDKPQNLVSEVVKINNKLIAEYDYLTNKFELNLEGTKNLNKNPGRKGIRNCGAARRSYGGSWHRRSGIPPVHHAGHPAHRRRATAYVRNCSALRRPSHWPASAPTASDGTRRCAGTRAPRRSGSKPRRIRRGGAPCGGRASRPRGFRSYRSAPRPQVARRPSAAATGNSRRNNRMPAVSSAAG